ncbi:MAG: hypothetical protein M1820_009105 [Bogoriella megaspora]|nr:MAG: hypothetical protein M1820_009105 [Bogoriella megaspora]
MSSQHLRLKFLQEENHKELEQLESLIYLFHYRNKNQHRCSIWWRSFETFRRELRCLVEEIGRWLTATADLSKGSWPKGAKGMKVRMALVQKNAARKPVLEAKVQKRIQWWADGLAEKWWIAFTHVLTLKQFAHLGIFLIATLSRVASITSLTSALEQLADAETEVLLTRFANEESSELFGSSSPFGVEDVGEVVQRIAGIKPDVNYDATFDSTEPGQRATDPMPDELEEPDITPLAEPETLKRSAASLDVPRKSSRKMRKTGNAIDDLFNGLV